MVTKFVAREVTEDDCFGRSNSENREGIDGAIHAYRRKTRFSTEGLEDVEPLWEKRFQDQDLVGPCSFSTRRISWVSER